MRGCGYHAEGKGQAGVFEEGAKELVARSKLYGGNLMREINALGERCGEVQRRD